MKTMIIETRYDEKNDYLIRYDEKNDYLTRYDEKKRLFNSSWWWNNDY